MPRFRMDSRFHGNDAGVRSGSVILAQAGIYAASAMRGYGRYSLLRLPMDSRFHGNDAGTSGKGDNIAIYSVILAQAIHAAPTMRGYGRYALLRLPMDSRFRGNDGKRGATLL